MYSPLPQSHLFLNFGPQSPPLTIGMANKNATDKYLKLDIVYRCLCFRGCLNLFLLGFFASRSIVLHSIKNMKMAEKGKHKVNLMVQNNGLEF
jgi:hypothetical protein